MSTHTPTAMVRTQLPAAGPSHEAYAWSQSPGVGRGHARRVVSSRR